MSEFIIDEFRFYLNNFVRTIEMVLTEDRFEVFIRLLKTIEFNNNITELNLSIGNSSYLCPLLNALMGRSSEKDKDIECISNDQFTTSLPSFLFESSDRRQKSRRSSPKFPFLKRIYLYHMHDTIGQKVLIKRFIKNMQMLEEFRTGDFKWKRDHVYDFSFTVDP